MLPDLIFLSQSTHIIIIIDRLPRKNAEDSVSESRKAIGINLDLKHHNYWASTGPK